MRLRYQMRLVDDLSLPSTAGRGEGVLGMIPGAMILGAVAKKLYKRAQDQDLAWDLFHSGAVSFGDALPLDKRSDAPMVRTPLSLHHIKKMNIEEDASCEFFNLISEPPQRRVARAENEVQLEQTRRMITPTGWFDKVKGGYTLKTSIELKTQKAQEGMLFGHSYLNAGQRFGFTVLIDDTHAHADTLKALVEEGLSSGVRIGKSRGAEFGGVQVSPIAEPPAMWVEGEPDTSAAPDDVRVPHPEHSHLEMVSYLLLSETCLIDPLTGEPTLTPDVAHLGLDATKFSVEPEYSFTRATRWTPYNAYRARPDLERVALVGGSVITVSASAEDWSALDIDQHLAMIERGIGAHTAEGMGRVKITHPFLASAGELMRRRAHNPQQSVVKRSAASVQPPSDTLGVWLAKRREADIYHEVALSVALELLKPAKERDVDCELDLSPLTQHKRTPSRSQWRNIETEARRYLFKVGGLKLLRVNLLEPPQRASGDREGVRGSGGLLIRGKSKDVWRLEGDDQLVKVNAPSIKSRPGLAVVALLSDETYAPFQDQLERLMRATTRRLNAWGDPSDDQTKLRALVIDFLAPMVLTYVSRAIAARLQQQEKA